MYDQTFGKKFAGMNEGSLRSTWDAANDLLTLHFDSLIYLDSGTGQTDHTVAKVMVTGDFHKFIDDLRTSTAEDPTLSQFFRGINQVIFTATGTSAR